MSKHTSAKSGVPSAKPGAPIPLRGRDKLGVVHRATVVFLEQGARAAHQYLGGSLRADILMPLVFARAKYLARVAKRVEEMNHLEHVKAQLAQEAA